MNQQLDEYFDKLFLQGIRLTEGQKNWYKKKREILNEDCLREYPSTIDEAFAASQDGYWYATQMRELHDAGHITNISYDRALPVHTAWDLGQADYQIIIFFQVTRAGEINIIDYLKKRNLDLNQTVAVLQQKGYTYGTHIWPHDANARDRAGITFKRQAADLNLNGIVLEIHDLKDGIRLTKSILGKCWFDRTKCKELIIDLENYKKKWSSSIGGWTSEELHDDASHGAAAMRYLASGITKVTSHGSIKNDYDAARKYFGG
jgi:hypothetical protein